MAKRVQNDIFLTASEFDRYDLYRRIQAASTVQLTTAQRLAHPDTKVTDINLRQLAALANRNYGSVYNMYNDLVELLKTMDPDHHGPVAELFNQPAGQVRFAMVKKGSPYAFLQAVLAGEYERADDWLVKMHTSKVTMLRHLKPLRTLAQTLGVRLHYERMSITGDERRVRLLLTLAFWISTDGAEWPFAIPRDKVLAAIDLMFDTFESTAVNAVTREVGAYYLAVALAPVCQGHVVDYAPQQMVLKYPVPNLYAELKRHFGDSVELPPLKESVQLGESTYAYFLTNFSPMFVTPQATAPTQVIARFGRYNPEIYQLVTDFLDRLPADLFDARHLPAGTHAILVANLLAVTVSTITFGLDIGALISGIFSQSLNVPGDPALLRKVHQTLDNIIATNPATTQYAKLVDSLTKSYYANLLQITARYEPTQTVTVLPLMEQTALGYVDLYTFLLTQPFVKILPADAPPSAADVVVQASSVPLSKAELGNAIFFKWNFNPTSDHFGNLYALLRELWTQKNATLAATLTE